MDGCTQEKHQRQRRDGITTQHIKPWLDVCTPFQVAVQIQGTFLCIQLPADMPGK